MAQHKSFTIIELLVVIAIIGLLAAIVLVGLKGARERAMDARRQSDLDQIRTAMHIFFASEEHWIETGSGCGWRGNGQGWFNYVNGNPNSYPKSIVQCLIDAGVLSTELIDPTGGRWSTPMN